MPLFNLLRRRKRIAFGIDIGHSGLKVAVFRREGERKVVEKLHLRNFPPGVMAGGKVMGEDTVVEAIKDIWRKETFPKGTLVAAVPGGNVEVKRIRLPVMDKKELDRYVALEAEQAFAMHFLSLIIDYVILEEEKDHMDLLVVAVPRDKVALAKDLFYRAGVDLHVLDVKPLALYRLFTFLGGDKLEGLSVILDIGKSITTVVMVLDGEFLCAREVYVGGDVVTEMIQKEEGLTYGEAEALKKEKFSQKPHGKKILNKFVVSLGHELKLVLDSCRLWLESGEGEVRRVFYTGGGALLENFDKAFEERFDVEAKSMYYLNSERMMGERVEVLDRYSVALGLSIRGAVI